MLTVRGVAKTGNMLDVRIMRELEAERSGKKEAKVYKSTVCEIDSENSLQIAMPMEGGKMILFDRGLQVELTIHARPTMYKCKAVVQDRYKKDGLYFLDVVCGKLTKFQRREFFRIECIVDFKFYVLPEDWTMSEEKAKDLYLKAQSEEVDWVEDQGVILDISGGGIRFLSTQKLEEGRTLLVFFRLKNDKMDQTFYIHSELLASIKSESAEEKYMNRAKFLFQDLRDRENIVKYVFEEERKRNSRAR